MAEFNDEKLSLDDVSEVSGGISEEAIARWNAEYEMYKDMLMPGTTVVGTIESIKDSGILVTMVPGTILHGREVDNFNPYCIEVGDRVAAYIKYVDPRVYKILVKILEVF